MMQQFGEEDGDTEGGTFTTDDGALSIGEAEFTIAEDLSSIPRDRLCKMQSDSGSIKHSRKCKRLHLKLLTSLGTINYGIFMSKFGVSQNTMKNSFLSSIFACIYQAYRNLLFSYFTLTCLQKSRDWAS